MTAPPSHFLHDMYQRYNKRRQEHFGEFGVRSVREIHAHPVSLLKDATRRPMLVGDKNPRRAGPCTPN